LLLISAWKWILVLSYSFLHLSNAGGGLAKGFLSPPAADIPANVCQTLVDGITEVRLFTGGSCSTQQPAQPGA